MYQPEKLRKMVVKVIHSEYKEEGRVDAARELLDELRDSSGDGEAEDSLRLAQDNIRIYIAGIVEGEFDPLDGDANEVLLGVAYAILSL